MTTNTTPPSEAQQVELLPCPFCGGSAALNKHTPECYFTVRTALNAAPDADCSLVPELLEAWNRRAVPQPVASGQEAVAWMNTKNGACFRAGIDNDTTKTPAYLAGELVRLYAAPRPQRQVERTTVADEVLNFLHGTAPLDGVWFGEKHPSRNGVHWWRTFLPTADGFVKEKS